jgi:hypothetical protein
MTVRNNELDNKLAAVRASEWVRERPHQSARRLLSGVNLQPQIGDERRQLCREAPCITLLIGPCDKFLSTQSGVSGGVKCKFHSGRDVVSGNWRCMQPHGHACRARCILDPMQGQWLKGRGSFCFKTLQSCPAFTGFCWWATNLEYDHVNIV